MDPYEIEFIGENRIISIIPNFAYDKIYLICGEFGPFRAGLPMNVPLWLAMMLKQKHKCRIVPPDWMDLEVLETIKEEEKRCRFFTKMPNEHYMVEAKLILGAASEDVPNAAEIKTTIKDIWDIRMSKLRTSMDALMKSGGGYGRLDHLTMMEINSVKPLLPGAMDYLLKIQLVAAPSKELPSYMEIPKPPAKYGKSPLMWAGSAVDDLAYTKSKKTAPTASLNTSTFSQSGSSQNT